VLFVRFVIFIRKVSALTGISRQYSKLRGSASVL